MIIAGITGTIGTGKSTVAGMFKDLGAYVIDHDQLARQVVEPGKTAWQGIIGCFGREVLEQDQSINRSKLAALVFNDPQKLQKLNSIVHPAILDMDTKLVAEIKKADPNAFVVKDVPLLLEIGRKIARLLVDRIIVVYASPEIQLKRLIYRGMPEADARRRIENQIPVKDKLKDADFVINNDGTLDETREQVKNIYSAMLLK
jgi:dephospho-CoA kinase